MLTNRRRDHRADLKDKRVADKFAIFEELRAAGGTDYLAFSIPFGDPVTAFERRSGICTSWVSDAPDGFSDAQAVALRELQPFVGLAVCRTERAR